MPLLSLESLPRRTTKGDLLHFLISTGGISREDVGRALSLRWNRLEPGAPVVLSVEGDPKDEGRRGQAPINAGRPWPQHPDQSS
jgi:hypothetical protein